MMRAYLMEETMTWRRSRRTSVVTYTLAGVAGVDSHDVVRQPFMDRVSVFWWAVALLACLSVAPPGIAFIMLAKGML